MADAYLAISQIATDSNMTSRVAACAAQQQIDDPVGWTLRNNYEWAASPSWGEKWDSALASHPDDGDPDTPPYQPGADPAVITDSDILSTVQALNAGG